MSPLPPPRTCSLSLVIFRLRCSLFPPAAEDIFRGPPRQPGGDLRMTSDMPHAGSGATKTPTARCCQRWGSPPVFPPKEPD